MATTSAMRESFRRGDSLHSTAAYVPAHFQQFGGHHITAAKPPSFYELKNSHYSIQKYNCGAGEKSSSNSRQFSDLESRDNSIAVPLLALPSERRLSVEGNKRFSLCIPPNSNRNSHNMQSVIPEATSAYYSPNILKSSASLHRNRSTKSYYQNIASLDLPRSRLVDPPPECPPSPEIQIIKGKRDSCSDASSICSGRSTETRAESVTGSLKRKPVPPKRRSSKLLQVDNDERSVRRGTFDSLSCLEDIFSLTTYDITFASQILVIIRRSGLARNVEKIGMLHADPSSTTSNVSDLYELVTGESLFGKPKPCPEFTSKTLPPNLGTSAPSLVISPTSPERAHLSKHRASTDSTDSGVGSSRDFSESATAAVSPSSDIRPVSYHRYNSNPGILNEHCHTSCSTMNLHRRSLVQQPAGAVIETQIILYHYGDIDILPCFKCLKGIEIEVHHFSLKRDFSTFIRISRTGNVEPGFIPRS